jgi:hypothetical protein
MTAEDFSPIVPRPLRANVFSTEIRYHSAQGTAHHSALAIRTPEKFFRESLENALSSAVRCGLSPIGGRNGESKARPVPRGYLPPPSKRAKSRGRHLRDSPRKPCPNDWLGRPLAERTYFVVAINGAGCPVAVADGGLRPRYSP